MIRKALALALTPFLIAACGGDPASSQPAGPSGPGAGGTGGGGAGGSGGSVGSGPVTVDVAWRTCTLFSDGTGPEAECATAALPLRATDPGGETLPVYVKRYAKAGGTRTKQLWMLSGGPGGSGIIYEKRAELLAEDDATLEIYMPDHRGVGDSSRLGCPQEKDGSHWDFFISPQEWPLCAEAVIAEWGDKLDAFTVTNAAHDVGVLIDSTRREDAQVFVYGASYGTFWGQRYMQLFPEQADGVILDAIAPPTASLARQDQHADEAGVDLFDACAADPDCGPRFGGDPRAFALDLYTRLDEGHCPGAQIHGPGRMFLRRAFGQMMMGMNGRRLIPATLARADRCNDADVDAIQNLLGFYFLPNEAQDLVLREWGWILSNYVVFSELWETPEPTLEEMAAWREQAVVSRDVTSGFAGPLPVLPRYQHDEYYGGFADTQVPLLMIQGTWDPATRPGPAEVLKAESTGEHQTWVEIPRGAHGVLGSVLTVAGTSCGTQIVRSFLDAPKSPPDTSCLDELAPLTFDGEPALNMLLFGTEDAWGDP